MSTPAQSLDKIPVKIKQKAQYIAGKLPGNVSAIDPATLWLIVQIIIKLVSWFVSVSDVKENNLSLLQKSRLWLIIQFSGVKGATYKDVVSAVVNNLDWDTFNAVKQGQLV